jgi:predicted RecB family nuclease
VLLEADGLRLSAGDLSDFLACRHLTRNNLAVARGASQAPHQQDAGFEALIERGRRHEANVLAGFRGRGWAVRDLDSFATRYPVAERRTRDAMAEGVDVIYQGMLALDGQIGLPDFLVRADLLHPGRAGYEAVDAKLARTARARAVLQTAFYSRLLGKAQGFDPRDMHLALGGADGLKSFRVAEYAAYERQVARMLGEFVVADEDTYADPVEHCAVCRWRFHCATRRRDDDDLSLVAGLTARQRQALQAHGLATLAALGSAPEAPKVGGLGGKAVANVHAQARLQLQGRRAGRPQWEFREPERDEAGTLVPDRGLLALPPPAPGDLFFDIEGARHYSEDGKDFGLQYLFGVVDTAEVDPDGRPRYHAIWSFDRREEKAGFEQLIDFFTERRAKNPDLHIYHYNHYEPTAIDALSSLHGTLDEALGGMMGRFSSHAADVNALLTQKVFVDLYRVVRQGVRASVESYSIKKLEALIGYTRAVNLADVNDRMVEFDAALDEGSAREETETREIIRGYNEDDCRSTLVLRDWLEERRADLERQQGQPLPRPVPTPPEEDNTDPEVAALFERLMAELPEDPALSTAEENGRRLVANLLEWHRREDNPKWWNWFRLRGLSDEELVEDEGALGGLSFVAEVRPVRRSFVMRYRFPEQEHPFRAGDTAQTRDEQSPRIDAIDDEHCTIDVVQGPSWLNDRVTALLDSEVVRTPGQRERLKALAGHAATFGDKWPSTAAADLILRRRPRMGDGQEGSLRRDGETATDAGVRLALALDDSYLAIQGPPGTGKTYTAALQALALVAAGKKVGITANSHAVIGNLLEQIDELARDDGQPVTLGQKAEGDKVAECVRERGIAFDKNPAAFEALAGGRVQILGGTHFFWSRSEAAGAVHTLIVDEAGQMSLANTLAVAHAARNLILVGDPQQLSQPSQGAHPPGAGVSALEHILQGRAVMPPDLGLFIEQTRRMHPAICSFTSELFYDNSLTPIAGLEAQAILGDGVWTGSGLRFRPVAHAGNTDSSPEEARAVAEIVSSLRKASWRDAAGTEHPVGPGQILVVTPFNAQVHEIREALDAVGHGDVKVGTVDKFQGQEAPVTLYSMASSSAEHAPRGLEFLYERNRLNVATSRARCLTIVVASPDLVRVLCRTPQQMLLANALCAATERAAETTPS